MQGRIRGATMLMLAAFAMHATPARSAALSAAAQSHVTQVSEALRALQSDRSHAAQSRANRAIEVLLKDRSPAADEAMAALAGHYLGEAAEVECEIAARGERMVPLLERFDRAPPPLPLAASTVHSRAELIQWIHAGVRCD
ncbi:hypothetical protein [Lysobacter sp. FW306-1B-D06B]|uniref:hypothetical protein n=1 Tax=Lysobacter sp. FW306-1B-D06B TaxID=3140250 RepID=UPI00314004B9